MARGLLRLALAAIAPAAGCVIQADVGDACAPFLVTEVATDDILVPLEQTGATNDYVEISVDPGYSGEVDLEGYIFLTQERNEGVALHPSSPLTAVGEGPVNWLLLIANTAVLELLPGTDPSVIALQANFDFNDDGSAFEIRAPEELHYASCLVFDVPHLHRGFSYQPDGADGWCFSAVPTPGAENEGCLCDSDEC